VDVVRDIKSDPLIVYRSSSTG